MSRLDDEVVFHNDEDLVASDICLALSRRCGGGDVDRLSFVS